MAFALRCTAFRPDAGTPCALASTRAPSAAIVIRAACHRPCAAASCRSRDRRGPCANPPVPTRVVTSGGAGSDDARKPAPMLVFGAVFPVTDLPKQSDDLKPGASDGPAEKRAARLIGRHALLGCDAKSAIRPQIDWTASRSHSDCIWAALRLHLDRTRAAFGPHSDCQWTASSDSSDRMRALKFGRRNSRSNFVHCRTRHFRRRHPMNRHSCERISQDRILIRFAFPRELMLPFLGRSVDCELGDIPIASETVRAANYAGRMSSRQ